MSNEPESLVEKLKAAIPRAASVVPKTWATYGEMLGLQTAIKIVKEHEAKEAGRPVECMCDVIPPYQCPACNPSRKRGLGDFNCSVKSSDWLPIETAPKDGSRLRLKLGSFEADGWWEENLKTFLCMDSQWNLFALTPTHWAQVNRIQGNKP